MKKLLILLSSVCLGLALLLIHKPKEPACVKLETKLALVDDFCLGMAKEMAEGRCGELADDPSVLRQCLQVVVPAAVSACERYVGKHEMAKQIDSLCR
jgi:hypothetical protein